MMNKEKISLIDRNKVFISKRQARDVRAHVLETHVHRHSKYRRQSRFDTCTLKIDQIGCLLMKYNGLCVNIHDDSLGEKIRLLIAIVQLC